MLIQNEHRTPEVQIPAPLIAARNAAKTFVERHDLVPPVPILELLQERAEVIEEIWPGDSVDALMLRRDGLPAQVFYKRHDHRGLRDRFTLGHELGHLVLPWQLGNASCFAGDNGFDSILSGDEVEADVFASCLLAPDRWLRQLAEKHGDNMSELLVAATQAEISATATLLALRRALPIGWVFQLNARKTTFTSIGTSIPNGYTSPEELRRSIGNRAQDSGTVNLHSHTVQWWRLTSPYGLPDEDADPRTTTELLRSAIAQFVLDPAEARRIEQSANGKVGGGTKDDAGKPAAELYAGLKFRFKDVPYQEVVSHPDFELWLARKARAKAAKAAKY